MNRLETLSHQFGAAVFEVLLVLPMLALAFAFLVWVSERVLLRQQALVAARYAAFYRVMSNADLPAVDVSQAVGATKGKWTVVTNTSNDFAGKLLGDAGPESEVIQAILGALPTGRVVRCHAASSVHSDGQFSQLGTIKATADYAISSGAWNNAECGALLPLLKERLGPLRSLL